MFPDFSPLITELQPLLLQGKPANFAALRDESLRQCRFVMGERWGLEQWSEAFIQHWIWAGVFSEMDEHFFDKNQLASDFQRVALAFVCHEKLLRQKAIITAAIKQQLAKTLGEEERKNALWQLIFDFYKHFYPNIPTLKTVDSGFTDFCIRQSDFLLQKHFSISIYNKNIAILDATGDWIKHRWANPISGLCGNSAWLLLQYYYSYYNNNNSFSWAMPIEQAHFQQIIGEPNSLFGNDLSDNAEKLAQQNEQKFNLVWANLNLPLLPEKWQSPQSEQRLRDSFAAKSRHHKPKVFSSETRLLRWAMDRAKPMGMAVLAVSTSFLEDAQADGIRACIEQESKQHYWLEMGETSLLTIIFQ